jgi:hypothetical protein
MGPSCETLRKTGATGINEHSPFLQGRINRAPHLKHESAPERDIRATLPDKKASHDLRLGGAFSGRGEGGHTRLSRGRRSTLSQEVGPRVFRRALTTVAGQSAGQETRAPSWQAYRRRHRRVLYKRRSDSTPGGWTARLLTRSCNRCSEKSGSGDPRSKLATSALAPPPPSPPRNGEERRAFATQRVYVPDLPGE